MRYAALGAGKRVRPLLAYAAGEVSGADVERATVAGAAVELIHAYSLVHDDMPC
ncbi:MAG: polyprenyl synthetase family protein, partial [Burkholderiales bacterium]|nr:polyprenyl synthetase family protein [Burkholderiales bacterium]